MVPGFNTDFKYRGETYHVQTEDNGLGNPVVVTLLYHKGAILASRRTPYPELIGKDGFEKEIMGLMKSQHKDLMRALLSGAYDKNGAAPAIADGSGQQPAAAAMVAGPAAPPLTKPPPERDAIATLRSAPAAVTALSRTTAARTATLPLDEAIRHYLEEFAATPAATAH